jgi:RIO kinase 1
VPPTVTTDGRAPAWLVSESYEERVVGVLKSGKEAEVFLVERRSSDASCLLAHKRYRPRHPRKGELRDLGFSKGTIYRHDSVYRSGWHLPTRDRRAVETGTAHGLMTAS